MDSPIVIIKKHSITLTPSFCNNLLAYTRYFIYDSRTHLDEYLRELELYKEHAPEEVPTKDNHIQEVQQAIVQAESMLTTLEPVADDVLLSYKRNYETLAEVLRQTRIELGVERIEDVYTFKVYLEQLCRMLWNENDLFSREKFISYINK